MRPEKSEDFHSVAINLHRKTALNFRPWNIGSTESFWAAENIKKKQQLCAADSWCGKGSTFAVQFCLKPGRDDVLCAQTVLQGHFVFLSAVDYLF